MKGFKGKTKNQIPPLTGDLLCCYFYFTNKLRYFTNLTHTLQTHQTSFCRVTTAVERKEEKFRAAAFVRQLFAIYTEFRFPAFSRSNEAS